MCSPPACPRRAWQRLSAGNGAKGQRYYDWAWVTVTGSSPGCRWLLIRRHPRTGELAFYRCYAPQPATLAALVKIAGRQMDHRGELPGRQGPHRPGRAPGPQLDLLAPLGHPRHARRRRSSPSPRPLNAPRIPRPDGQIPLTRNEIASLLASLVIKPANDARHRLRWSSLAAATPAPRPHMPLPAASNPRTMNITIYGWSTRARTLCFGGFDRRSPAGRRRRV